jgi:hypothetical protein
MRGSGPPASGRVPPPRRWCRDPLDVQRPHASISVAGTKPKIIGCVATSPRPRELTPVIVDTARMVLPDALTIPARAVTSVTTVEKSAMTQPPRQPPTQVFAQQRRSGCGTLLVALLVLAIITAIVIFLAAFGLLGWIFS